MPGMRIDALSRQRASALARRFHKDLVPPLVVARDLPVVAALKSHGGGTVEKLAAYPDKAWVWRLPNVDDCSVWARRRDERITRKIFEAFIEELYGKVDYNVPGSYQVDHVYNKANAPIDYFIRLEIIPQRINGQHGGGFERRNTSSTIEIANRNSEQGLMTFVMMLKIAGIAPPSSTEDTGQMAVVRHYFLQNGWHGQQIDQAIEALLTKAAWR